MNIIQFPNPLLKERMPEFDFNNPICDPVQLENDMLECMFNNNGIGLAANQVGVKARVFVMGYKNDPTSAKAYFNPMVVSHVDTLSDLTEGCLSFPGMFVNIKRPTKIIARWQSSTGVVSEEIIEGYDCKCFLHELDHLEGIVFKDRISSLKWSLATKKLKRK